MNYMMMKLCGYCGRENEAEAQRCIACGTQLGEQIADDTSKRIQSKTRGYRLGKGKLIVMVSVLCLGSLFIAWARLLEARRAENRQIVARLTLSEIGTNNTFFGIEFRGDDELRLQVPKTLNVWRVSTKPDYLFVMRYEM